VTFYLEIWCSTPRAWERDQDTYEAAVTDSDAHLRGPYRTRAAADRALDEAERDLTVVEVSLTRGRHGARVATYRRNASGALIHAADEEAL
jgi:hypothetical protein